MRNESTDPAHRDPLPESFDTLDEAGEFWDTHSSADYEDQMEDVDVEVHLSSTQVYCAIDRELARHFAQPTGSIPASGHRRKRHRHPG